MRKIFILFVVILSSSLLSSNAYAHSGRTDGNGCHRDTRTGQMHCHSSGGVGSSSNRDYYPTKELVIATGAMLATIAVVVLVKKLFRKDEQATVCNKYCFQVVSGSNGSTLFQEISFLLTYKK